MVAASALSAASLAAQGHADVARDSALVGPIGIYVISVAHSGERKTAVDKKLWAGVRRAREVIYQMREQQIALVHPRMAIWEKRREAIESALKQALKGNSPGNSWIGLFQAAQQAIPGNPRAGQPTPAMMAAFLEAELIAHYATKPLMPEPADLLHSDDTSEALAKSLAGGWPVAAISESEGGVIFGGIAMHKERVMRTFSFWNVLWDASEHIQKRTSVDTRRVQDVRVTINLMVQPAVLGRVLNDNNGLIRDIGLQARFMFFWPASVMGSRPYQLPTQTQPALDAFNTRCYDLLVNVPLQNPELPNGTLDTTKVKPPVLPLIQRRTRSGCTATTRSNRGW
ncbi:MAG: DUF3987 domain-containing protein [Acetobacteraceae bacterium]|nr:DUF3987 domain-containing protein [Acetobacteraceae bacterium]